LALQPCWASSGTLYPLVHLHTDAIDKLCSQGAVSKSIGKWVFMPANPTSNPCSRVFSFLSSSIAALCCCAMPVASIGG
jgi:hypothetical protein